MKTRFLTLLMACGLLAAIGSTVRAADPNRYVDPMVLKHMDDDIVDGDSPVIRTLHLKDVPKLRDFPEIKADAVRIGFHVRRLPESQRAILKHWVKYSGVNLLLVGEEMSQYAWLFDSVEVMSVASKRSEALECILEPHVVNRACGVIAFRAYYGGHNFETVLKSLPADAEIVVRRLNRDPMCGRFRNGDAWVYFYSPPSGRDARRWMLNYNHWMMGKIVPAEPRLDPPRKPAGKGAAAPAPATVPEAVSAPEVETEAVAESAPVTATESVEAPVVEPAVEQPAVQSADEAIFSSEPKPEEAVAPQE